MAGDVALIDEFDPEVEPAPLALASKGAVQLLLDLEAGGAATATALALPADLSYEQYEALGVYLGAVNRRVMWYLGDWLLFGEGAFADKYAQAAHETGLTEGTLLNRVYVCKHVPPSRRRAELSFGTHEAVSSLGAKEQKHWLDKAVKNGWKRADLRAAMQAKRKDDAPPMTDPDDPPSGLMEVALAILRDAKPAEDGQHHLIPNEDVARLKAAVGQEEGE